MAFSVCSAVRRSDQEVDKASACMVRDHIHPNSKYMVRQHLPCCRFCDIAVTIVIIASPCFTLKYHDHCFDYCGYLAGAKEVGFSPSALPFWSVMLKATCRNSLKFSVLKLPCSSLICSRHESTAGGTAPCRHQTLQSAYDCDSQDSQWLYYIGDWIWNAGSLTQAALARSVLCIMLSQPEMVKVMRKSMPV